MSVKPKIISFLIADKVIQEKATNKWSVIGIFDKIYTSNFPCLHNSLALYIRLSEAEGDYDIHVEFCDENDRILSMFEGIKLSASSRLTPCDFGVQTRNLPIPRPGKYWFKLYFNKEFIEHLPIIVEQIPAK